MKVKFVEYKGNLVALTHYSPLFNSLKGEEVGYLNDIFVHLDHRGKGIAKALFQKLETIASSKGWSAIRWLTAPDNLKAKAVYDQLAKPLSFETYEMSLFE